MLRLDRQPGEAPRRGSLCDQGDAAQADEQVVGYRPEALERIEDGWPACGPRTRGRPDGESLRATSIDPRLPAYVAKAFKADISAWRYFQSLAPTYRRQFVAWIHTAKRPATRERRIGEVIELLAAGKTLGLR
ncbi:MAG: YdeI/OmpD-associated family protein [Acidimicrobiia bacterium]|nr:YdeI/OmpD-associated family protein [Acidimicrobiia bacterium]